MLPCYGLYQLWQNNGQAGATECRLNLYYITKSCCVYQHPVLTLVGINSMLIIPCVRHCQTLKCCSAHMENSTLTYLQPGIYILSILLFSKYSIICLNCYVLLNIHHLPQYMHPACLLCHCQSVIQALSLTSSI